METKKQQKGWIILGIVALLLLGFFVYQNSDKFLPYDWRMSLDEKSKQPYGTQIIKTVLEKGIAQDSFILLDKKLGDCLPENIDGNSNFVFIGQALLLDTADVEKLLTFAENGNTVFISSLTIPNVLMQKVYFNACNSIYWEDYGTYYDTAVITNFVHPDLRATEDFSFPLVRQNKIYNNYWQKIDKYFFCNFDNYPVVISQSRDSIVDMAMFPYGDGAFYLQTSPIAFTNFYTTKTNGRAYAEKAFTHLNSGKIYWDDFSHVPVSIGRAKNCSGPSFVTDPSDEGDSGEGGDFGDSASSDAVAGSGDSDSLGDGGGSGDADNPVGSSGSGSWASSDDSGGLGDSNSSDNIGDLGDNDNSDDIGDLGENDNSDDSDDASGGSIGSSSQGNSREGPYSSAASCYEEDPLTPRKGPLDYILSQPALAWAWYLLLALGLLFLLFRSKRQQRIIPVLPKNRNTSLEFISTISRLHFKGDNHRRIALQKMDLVLAFIRNKYRMSFTETNTNFVEELSIASEIDKALLQKMFLLYTNIKSSKFTTDKTLIELHKLTDYFYKNSR